MRHLPILPAGWMLLLAACAQPRLIPFENENGFFGFRRESGRTVLPARYLDAKEFSGCCAYAADEIGWVVINRKGEKLFRPFLVEQDPDRFREGLSRFVLDGKVGFYDERFRIRIPARFVYAGRFRGGYARFCEECHRADPGAADSMSRGKWGFIDARGKVVIAPTFDFAFMPGGDSLRVLRGDSALGLSVDSFSPDELGGRSRRGIGKNREMQSGEDLVPPGIQSAPRDGMGPDGKSAQHAAP